MNEEPPLVSLKSGDVYHFLKLSFRDTLRLNTICSGLESLLSRQK